MHNGQNAFPEEAPILVTPENLAWARSVVTTIGEVNPATINDSWVLAKQMRGLSRAISYIIRDSEKFDVHNDMLEKFDDPNTRSGRRFTAYPSTPESCATFSVDNVTANDIRTVYGICVPTDRQIDTLLTDVPVLWHDEDIHATDYSGDVLEIAFPFSAEYYEEGMARQYFSILQMLSAELPSIA
jgi:hypothetical protein